MSDFRGRFIEDYAGGILNVSKQEQTSTGEVLAQNGLPADGSTLFVEDGTGVKSALKLGIGLAECLDPTTENGVVNVSFADRTYASIRDLKIFATSIASTQAALSQSVSASISNIEKAIALLESKVNDVVTAQAAIVSAVLVFNSRNDLYAALASQRENQVAIVNKDANSSYNGTYIKTTVAGVSSWLKL
jgi:hypothetical protein